MGMGLTLSVAVLILVFAGIAAFALYKVVRFFSKEQPHYTYTTEKDEDGNDVEYVVTEEDK